MFRVRNADLVLIKTYLWHGFGWDACAFAAFLAE
jgi:hypothetical protein